MIGEPTRPAVVAAGLMLVLAGPAWAATPSGPTTDPTTGTGTGTGIGTDGVVAGEGVLTTEGVEVTTYGVVRFHGYQNQDEPAQTMAVHGVQRVDGGTVVYLSLGFEGAGRRPSSLNYNEIIGTQIGGRYGGGGGLTGVRIVDRSADAVLSTLREPDVGVLTGALASKGADFPAEADVMVVAYAVVPELAIGTETVDVQLAFGLTVPDVPVGEGLFEPVAADGEGPVPLGSGWPAVDLQAVRAAPKPNLSRHPLTRVRQDLGGESTTTEESGTVTVDVAADVLFASDSAELSPQAQRTLQEVGEDVAARATGGALRVVGHTDSIASDAYNKDLSVRRAQAVATVLAPFAKQTGLRVQAEGRGEAEPVAENGTDEGRQANRRVSVTFDVGNDR